MHVKSGDKIMLAVVFQDFDGNAHEPSSYSVALWQTNNATGATEEVTPSLISDAEGKLDGYHLYEYTTPSGDYTYFWRYYTTDTDVLAQEVSEVHYSGGWADDIDAIKKHIYGDKVLDDSANTLTVMDEDGSTPLVTYDTKDGDGVAASQNIKRFIAQ